MRKATKNASVNADAPNARAISNSRSKPVTRESIVKPEIVARVLSKFMLRDYSPHTSSWLAAKHLFTLPLVQEGMSDQPKKSNYLIFPIKVKEILTATA
jgi:hypothetical protein